MNTNRVRRGFTAIECTFIVASSVLLIAVLVVVLGQPSGRRCGARSLKDASQIRGVTMGLALWAENNGGQFPIPSVIDLDNATVAQQGAAKDTTANFLSVLVFNGFLPPEMLVSPMEVNYGIRECEDYQWEAPDTAVDPENALWDPAFRADFSDGRVGHNSYAHMPPSGPRLAQWRPDQLGDRVAVLGNRGPLISAVEYGDDGDVAPRLANPNSNTLLMGGSRDEWSGSIGYADGHVDFHTDMIGGYLDDVPRYNAMNGRATPDLLFYDEPDDADGTNNFLGIFTNAGPQPSDFKAIWD